MSRNDSSLDLPTSWLARAYYTPIGDALRGHLSARLDPRAAIAEFDLPMSLAAVVLYITQRTRLWRRERIDVARELASHFADGLAAGRSAEQLARDFGDPRRAAKLIRKAKRRNRPWPWQVWHYSLRTLLTALGACLLLYLVIAVRFYWGKPTISHNYWNEINEARCVPEAERAWPVYRDTYFKLGKAEALHFIVHQYGSYGPSSKHWDDVVAYVDRHQDAISALREATKKPRLAFYVGDQADLDAATEHDGFWMVPKTMALASENNDAISMQLYGPQELRGFARILVADANVAASRGDGARATADLAALIALAEQQRNEPRATLVEQLIGMGIFEIATNTMGQFLFESPKLFSDSQLVELAHHLASYQSGRPGVDMSAEAMIFEDVLQRVYTDDGHGDGRVTLDGLKLLDDYAAGDITGFGGVTRGRDWHLQAGAAVLAPAFSLLVGRRAEMRTTYFEMFESMIANHQGPSWRWNRAKLGAAEDRLKRSVSGLNRPRYIVASLLLPALSSVYSAAERSLQFRDASETAIALELWHRNHEAWPDRLDQLVPDLLPEVPRDRVDGEPLRYVLRDGRPVLYSIGVDWKDDGGVPNTGDPKSTIPGTFGPRPTAFAKDPAVYAAGDWILWPPTREKEPEDQDDSSPPMAPGS